MVTEPTPLPSGESLFEDAACGLLLAATDGRILRMNRTLGRWLGRDPAELAGTHRLQDLLTVGGRIFHQTHWVPLLQMQGSIAEVKLELKHQDGRSVPVLVNAVRRPHQGTVLDEVAFMVAEDRHKYERELLIARKAAEALLGQQRQAQQAAALAEARLRVAIDSAQLSVWEIDPATGVPRYGSEAAGLLGLPPGTPVAATLLAERIHPEDRERQATDLARALGPEGQTHANTYRIEGMDGVQRTVASSGRGIFDADGRLLQFAGVLHDVTELTRQRAAAEDRALLAEQMVGIVSHDLRNPLSAIQMSAHVLARGELSPNQLRVLGRITSSTGRAQRLIADLLDFTQARVGKGLAVAPRPVDLHALVSDSIDELGAAFAGRQLEHMRHGSGACDADADRLTQLVGNLVANAMAYGATDRPVCVTSRVADAYFSIDVHNHGTPVPPDVLPTLFQAMVRGAEQASAGRSVGLGLFIVREIARAHGGTVQATSDAVDGTRFTARFPRRRGS